MRILSKKAVWPVKLFLFFLILICSSTALALWSPDESFTTENLREVYIHTTNNTAWCVGDNGTVLKNELDFNSWMPVFLDSNNFRDIKFIKIMDPMTQSIEETQTGFIIGSEGALFRTSDGGNTWQRLSTGTLVRLNSIFLSLDGQNGWIAGDSGLILKTSDAGITWTPVSTGVSENLYGIIFSKFNPNTGIVVGANGLILKTADSGQNWQQIIAYDLYGSMIYSDLNAIAVSYIPGSINPRFWVVGNQATMLYSEDEGFSWNQIQTEVLFNLNDIFFLDYIGFGYVAGEMGIILFNNGQDFFWSEDAIAEQDLYAIYFGNDLKGYAVGDMGAILYSYDGGTKHESIQSVCKECHQGELPVIHGYDTIGDTVCRTCHRNPNITPSSFECESCHGEVDHLAAHDQTFLPSDQCFECHVSNVVTEHVDNRGLDCIVCHNIVDPDTQNAIENGKAGNPVYCGDCHGEADHLAAHDQTFFTSDSADDVICSSCHAYAAVSVVTEHTARGWSCATCHSNTDQNIQDAITRGQEGQPVYCVDCHYQSEEAYDIHVSGHNEVCAVCHKLPEDGEGNTFGIHSKTTKAIVWCTNCHRYGDTDMERNTIFSVSVNDHVGEPPDNDYDPSPYLAGPCLKCHTMKKLNMGGGPAKGCLPCHFNISEDSWPNGRYNDYYGSETWGHNFKKSEKKKRRHRRW